MSHCGNYVEHAWKKGKCVNCFQAKERHHAACGPSSCQTSSDQLNLNGNRLQSIAEKKRDLKPGNNDVTKQVSSHSTDDRNLPIVNTDSVRNRGKISRTIVNNPATTSNHIAESTAEDNCTIDQQTSLKDANLPVRNSSDISKTKPVPKPRPRRSLSSSQSCESNTTQESCQLSDEFVPMNPLNNAEEGGVENATQPSDHKNTEIIQDELNTPDRCVREGYELSTDYSESVPDEQSLVECDCSDINRVTSCKITNESDADLQNLNIATGETKNSESENVTSSHAFGNSEQELDTSAAQQGMEIDKAVGQVSNEAQQNPNESEYVAMNGNPSVHGKFVNDKFTDYKEVADGEEITDNTENFRSGSGSDSTDQNPTHRLKWSLDRQSNLPSRELLEDFKFELPRTTTMGAMESSHEVPSDYEQFSPSLSCKVRLVEPFYENRPSSLSSERQSIVSSSGSSEKAEYENTLNGGVVSPVLSDPLESDAFSSGNDGSPERVGSPYENTGSRDVKSPILGTSDSLRSDEGVFVERNSILESSGDSVDTHQSDSTWGSSEWDSQSSDSNIETSASESLQLHGPKLGGIPTIPENEILCESSLAVNTEIQRRTNFSPENAKKRQSNPDIKDRINDQLPAYSNVSSKVLTKPYKVVDVSSGVLFEPGSLSGDLPDMPPLPPKIKDLIKKDDLEVDQHEYMPPPENVPQKSQYNSPQPAPLPDGPKLHSRKLAPVPRPRSTTLERNSQFGSLPRPAPRTSRVLVDLKPEINKVLCNTHQESESQDIPEPPSPSTIPCRQDLEMVTTSTLPYSPLPISPVNTPFNTTQVQVMEGTETLQSSVSESRKTPDGLGTRPKRMAPPPPVGGNQRPKSPEVNVATSPPPPITSNISSPSKSPRHKETFTFQNAPQQSEKRSAPPPPGDRSSPAPSPSAERKYSKTNSLKKAWLKFSKKRNSKSYRSMEISGPILVNEEVPGYLEQQMEVKRRAMSEGGVSTRSSVSSEIVDVGCVSEASKLSQVSSMPCPSAQDKPNQNIEPATSPSVPFRKNPHGYQNFPLSKATGILEKPKKPVRATKAVRPLGLETNSLSTSFGTEDGLGDTSSHADEPAYLQPCKTEMTRKVEAALSKLNDATLLAEALSRVEQEKLGPLPNVPQSRHVHFQYEAKLTAEDQSSIAEKKPSLPPKRPVRIVNPTLVNGVAGSGDASQNVCKTEKPKLPSRPPNTKLNKKGHRGRSLSVGDECFSQMGSGFTRSKSVSSQSRVLAKRYNKIMELHLQTLQEVINSSKKAFLPSKDLDVSNTRWRDYEVCGRLLDIQCPQAALLPVRLVDSSHNARLLAKVEIPQQSNSNMVQRSAFKHDLRVCELMEHHVNLSRVLTHFTDQVPADVIGVPGSVSYETKVSVSDQFPLETMTDFLERTRDEHEEQPKVYEKKICLLLLQLFAALQHLHSEGVVHRDLKTENLFLFDGGLLVVANFEHALQQGKTTKPGPFLLSVGASSHLGGNVEHLPPEILNAPEDAKTLDYEKCDVFAAGCLLYEMLHAENPYSRDSSLIKRKYHVGELFSLPERSCYSKGLGLIASKLLFVDPEQRADAKEALEMLRVVFWGPDCLEDSGTASLESMASDWLETERAHMVAMIARNQTQACGPSSEQDDFMEKFLKCQYLVEANGESIVDSYKQIMYVAENEK